MSQSCRGKLISKQSEGFSFTVSEALGELSLEAERKTSQRDGLWCEICTVE